MRSARWLYGLAVAACAASALIALPWEPNSVHDFHRNLTAPASYGPRSTAAYSRQDVTFTSQGVNLHAWLYLPAEIREKAPILIMGHGIGAQKDMGLDVYATQFAAAGIAVLTFDYRCFGGSDGEPRHWVSPRRHLQDWDAAIRHVKAGGLGEGVDASRTALWGVSYGGGHVLVTASRWGANISAVVANEPFLSPGQALAGTLHERGVVKTLRLAAAAVSDQLRRLLRMTPTYIQLTGSLSDARSLALVPLQESEVTNGAQERAGGWRNLVTARVLFEAVAYRPLDTLQRITAPVYLRAALLDHVCPHRLVMAAADKLRSHAPEVVVHERNHTHIGAHKTGAQPAEIAPVIEFLRRHLKLAAVDQQVASS